MIWRPAGIDEERASALVAAIEAGESPEGAVARLGLEPVGLIGAMAQVALAAGGPPLVHGSPMRPRLRSELEEAALSSLFPMSTRPARLALSAGLLQIFDFWDASHAAAQEADDLGEVLHSAYWHAIAHRREPDAANSMYWFRRVGRHPVYAALARVAPEFVGRGGGWDPGGFVAACTRARRGSEEEARCRSVQRVEMALLLDTTAEAVS